MFIKSMIFTMSLTAVFNSFAVLNDPTTIFNNQERVIADLHNVVNDLPHWETTPDALDLSMVEAIVSAEAKLNAMPMLKDDELTFENTVGVLDAVYYEVGQIANRASVLSAASIDKAVREFASKVETKISNWFVDTNARKDIYLVIQKFANSNPKLDSVEQKLLNETLRDYKRVGFHLPAETQVKITALKKELSEITTKIADNIKKAGGKKITFSKAEMKGMPAGDLASLEVEGDNYIAKAGVTYQVYAVLKNSPIEAVRKKAMIARNQRAMITNAALTVKVVQKRAELANMLGYNTWADYKTEVKMAKTGKTALDFVDGLIAGLEPKYQAETEALRKLKVEETGDSAAVINSWDVRYYQKILEKKLFNLDMSSLKKYFSYDSTLNGMFKVFEKIFKLKIEFVNAPYVWEQKVKLIRITDAQTGKPLGFLYLDMFPRPDQDKYGHFAMFTIRSGKMLDSGKYRRPVAALICNFPLPQGNKPSLLDFGQVETMFHEFGHALHGIVTESRFASFSGTNVARDFVEAPSQMLESWVHDKNVLDMFAVNYADTTDKFPADALKKIKAAGLATVGLMYRRQLAFGKMDLMLHQNIKSDQSFNIADVTNTVLKDVYFAFPDNTSMISAFGHLWGGYDAGYYGYAWADSISADLTSKFENSPEGFLDVEMGMKLRREIYQVGSTRDITVSIESFLGRATNNAAFLKKLGIN